MFQDMQVAVFDHQLEPCGRKGNLTDENAGFVAARDDVGWVRHGVHRCHQRHRREGKRCGVNEFNGCGEAVGAYHVAIVKRGGGQCHEGPDAFAAGGDQISTAPARE